MAAYFALEVEYPRISFGFAVHSHNMLAPVGKIYDAE